MPGEKITLYALCLSERRLFTVNFASRLVSFADLVRDVMRRLSLITLRDVSGQICGGYIPVYCTVLFSCLCVVSSPSTVPSESIHTP